MDKLLTVEDVAKSLQVHEETVRRWLRDGKLEGLRISRRAGWRIRPESVDRMMFEGDQLGKLAA